MMHRLEPTCKDSQTSLDKVGVHGGSSWPTASSLASQGAAWANNSSGPSGAAWANSSGSSGGAWANNKPSVEAWANNSGETWAKTSEPWANNKSSAWANSPSGSGWASSSLALPGTSWSSVGLGPPSGVSPSTSSSSPSSTEPLRKNRVFNIHQRLRELYLEECRNGRVNANLPVPLRNLKRGSRLLEKLVERENLNTLIVNLYPGNKGYSLSLRLQGKVPAALGTQAGRSQGSEPVIETMRWPYSDEELLRCIDREELPATLVDLLETEHSKLFYQGCVIAEIRDSRLTFPLCNFETHHVLLKPTTQSILNDVSLLSSAHELSVEERLSLESQIVQATAPPLCLDPNPAVGLLLNNIQAKKHRLSTAPLRRTARKFSQVTVNRKRKLDQFTAHDSLQLYDFIIKKKAKASQGKQSKKLGDGMMPAPPPVPREQPFHLLPPEDDEEVFKYAKTYPKPKETTDCIATLVEEYILETERTQGTIYHIKLTILQRASNCEYLGELYVDKDYKEGERNGASCRFVLGTRAHANRYIQQFTEIFTEEGRKSVRITHVMPGLPGRVSFTQGMRERTGQLQAIQAARTAHQVAGNLQNPLTANNLAKAPVTSLQSVSHLTHLLKNAAVPPNVNVHQIQQQAQQQPVTALSNSAIQSILSGALSSGVLQDAGLANGPTHVNTPSQPSNATVHYQPVPTGALASSSKPPSRPPLSSNPKITALATILRNSVEQYEMQVAASEANQASQAQAAAAAPAPSPAPQQQQPPQPPSAQNSTILSLLNTPTHQLTNLNQKLVARKSNVNIPSARLLNQNLNAALGNNVNNSALRVTLSSFPNQLVTANSQTYSLSGLTQQQGQTYTLTPNSGSSQGYTLSPAAGGFTVLQPNQGFGIPSVQSQTFQISPGTTGQTYTITTPVVTASQFAGTVTPSGPVFTVNIPQTVQSGKGGKAFGIQERRLSNAFQQVAHASELNKLLSERSDSRVLTERHIGDKGGQDAGKDVGQNLGLAMPGLSALLAGTPSADNPIPGAASASSLLDRLAAPPAAAPPPSPAPSPAHSITFPSPSHAFNSVTSNSPLPSLTSPSVPGGFASPSPKTAQGYQGQSPTASPLSSPPGPPGSGPVSLNLQGLSLQGLTSLSSGLQVSLPGIAVPISLSLNVSGQSGVLMTSLPVTATTNTTTTSPATMVLANSSASNSLLSLPVAQIMGSGSKTSNARSPGAASIAIPQGTAQSIQLVSALQRPTSRSSANQVPGTKSVQPIAARGVSSDQRPSLKMAANAAGAAQLIGNSAPSQMVALSPQQFQLLQKHGFQGLNISGSCLAPQKNANSISAAAIASKHRRRSSTADPNK